jgi:predicted metal-dependent peptidase
MFADFSNDPVRGKLPLEHFANNPALQFFMEVFLIVGFDNYHKDNDKDNFLACVGVGRPPVKDGELDKKELNKVSEAERTLMITVALDRLAKFPVKQQMFILAHEAGHVLLSHLVKCDKYDSPFRWNIAVDSEINSILLSSYGGALEQFEIDGRKAGITVESLKNEGHIETDKSADDLNAEEVYDMLKDKEDKEGKGGGGGKRTLADLDGDRVDKHDPSLNPDRLPEDVKRTIEDMLKRAENNAYGSQAGDFVRKLRKIVKKNFDFKSVLDPIFTYTKYDYNRGSRRIRIKDAFVPRTREIDFKVYAMLDTSGSCEGQAENFLGYLLDLPQIEEICFCDTRITKVWKKGEPFPTASFGGGGTDLNEVFERWEKLEAGSRGTKMNFVALTDGEIPELTHGPRESTTIVFTSHNDVQFAGSRRPYMNVEIPEK